jgi:predicted PurR-regulated permease PerM
MEKSRQTVLFGFVVTLLIILAYTIRQSLIAIYISCIFAIVLSPVVDWVSRMSIAKWHPGRGMALILMIITVLLAFTLLFAFGLPPVISDLQQLFTRFPQEVKKMREHISHVPLLNQLDGSRIEEYSASVIAAIPGLLGGITSGIASIAGITVLTAYLILEGNYVFAWAMALFPPGRSEELKPILLKAAERMRKWLVGQVMLMLILGTASIIVFGLLGVRYFYLLGVFAGLANFIPLLGPIVTVILAGFVAAFDSWGKLIGVLVFFFMYQQIENAFLTPRIMKSQVELSASAVLIALLIGAELAGIAGAMMAVPTAVLVSTMIDSFVIHKQQAK